MSKIDNNGAAFPVMDGALISIIVPVLNEAQLVVDALSSLSVLRASGCEIIVVDGGSVDGTADLARHSGLADLVLSSGPGRAKQMNDGAAAARGVALLFLHVDTRLPPGADALLRAALDNRHDAWGRFDVRIDGLHWVLPIVANCMNLRSRWTGIATGDQAMFVTRTLFERSGGFPRQPLMEDISLSRVLKQYAAPLCLRARVTTSGRRWERNGAFRTILMMWQLRLAYFLGSSPEKLARRYQLSGPA